MLYEFTDPCEDRQNKAVSQLMLQLQAGGISPATLSADAQPRNQEVAEGAS